jgi:hypothetical protein
MCLRDCNVSQYKEALSDTGNNPGDQKVTAMKPDVSSDEPLNRKEKWTFVKNHDLTEKEIGSKNIKCDECEAPFMTANGLWLHMEMMHTNTKQILC